MSPRNSVCAWSRPVFGAFGNERVRRRMQKPLCVLHTAAPLVRAPRIEPSLPSRERYHHGRHHRLPPHAGAQAGLARPAGVGRAESGASRAERPSSVLYCMSTVCVRGHVRLRRTRGTDCNDARHLAMVSIFISGFLFMVFHGSRYRCISSSPTVRGDRTAPNIEKEIDPRPGVVPCPRLDPGLDANKHTTSWGGARPGQGSPGTAG